MSSKSGIVSFRPDDDVREFLEYCSKDGDCSKTWVINRALRYYKRNRYKFGVL